MKDIQTLRNQRTEYLKQLTDVGHQLRSFAREQQLNSELANLDSRWKTAKYELDLASERVKKNEQELAQVNSQLKSLNPKIKKLEQEIEKRKETMDELTASIRKIEDEIFQDFSQQVGVDNFREYEEAKLNHAKTVSETKLRYSTQKARINTLLEYETQRDLRKTLEAQEAKLNADRDRMKELTVRLTVTLKVSN